MTNFHSRNSLNGWPAATAAGFGIVLLVVAAAIASRINQSPGLAWTLSGSCCLGGILLIGCAIYYQVRRVTWVLEANAEKIVWHRTGSNGVVRDRHEVRVSDLASVTYTKGGPESGGGLSLVMRSGEVHAISGIVRSDSEFLRWASDAYPSVKVEFE